MTTPIQQALALGQSIWYDGIRRSLLTSGELEHRVKKAGMRGMTSNSAIFDAAIAGSSDLGDATAELRRSGRTDAKSVYGSLAVADIRAAADIFRPVSAGCDGVDVYVSVKVSPELAHDTVASAAEVTRLWGVVDRSNAMVKVPGSEEDVSTIQEFSGAGGNVTWRCWPRGRRARPVRLGVHVTAGVAQLRVALVEAIETSSTQQ